VIQKLGYDTVYLYAKVYDSGFSHKKIINGGSKIQSESRDRDHVPFKGDLSFLYWDLI